MTTSRMSGTDLHGLLNPVQKRARTQLSCTACRIGKLKCNRGHPCDQCVKRSKDDCCHYVAAPTKKKANQNMKDRVKNLEKLVIQLIEEPGSPKAMATPPESVGSGHSPSSILLDTSPSQPSTVGEVGMLQVSKKGTTYVGSTHWASILNDIEEVKASLEKDDDESSADEDGDSPGMMDQRIDPAFSLLLGTSTFTSREDLLASLPKKADVDKIIDYWLVVADPLTMSLHKPSFLRQYHAFWMNSSETSLMWIALLFGILAMASRMMVLSESPGHKDLISAGAVDCDKYLMSCATALCMGDFTNPKEYTLEALWIFIFCDIFRLGSIAPRTWLLTGLLLRLAVRMGYHRDPDHYGSSLSPFNGEMRRRVWMIISHVEIFASFHLGLPSMISALKADTKNPRNLLDIDFDVSTEILPPDRPPSDATPVIYGIHKFKFSEIFYAATQLSCPDLEEAYPRALALDRELDKIQADTPKGLLEACFNRRDLTLPASATTTNLMMCGFNLAIMFHKAKCIIHRHFLRLAWKDPRYECSRLTTMESALELLEFHHKVYKACMPNGLLSTAPWYLITLNSEDFLLAAMVICLNLSCYCSTKKGPCPERRDGTQSSGYFSKERLSQIIVSLQRSGDIFMNQTMKVTHARKAAATMQAMIDKVRPIIASLESEMVTPESSNTEESASNANTPIPITNVSGAITRSNTPRMSYDDYVPLRLQNIHLESSTTSISHQNDISTMLEATTAEEVLFPFPTNANPQYFTADATLSNPTMGMTSEPPHSAVPPVLPSFISPTTLPQNTINEFQIQAGLDLSDPNIPANLASIDFTIPPAPPFPLDTGSNPMVQQYSRALPNLSSDPLLSELDRVNQMIDIPDMDWQMWDSFIRGVPIDQLNNHGWAPSVEDPYASSTQQSNDHFQDQNIPQLQAQLQAQQPTSNSTPTFLDLLRMQDY